MAGQKGVLQYLRFLEKLIFEHLKERDKSKSLRQECLCLASRKLTDWGSRMGRKDGS